MSGKKHYKVSGPNWTAVWPLTDDEADRYRAEGLVVEEVQPEGADDPDAWPDYWSLPEWWDGDYEDRVAGNTY